MRISDYEPGIHIALEKNETQGQHNFGIGRVEHKLHSMYCT